MIANLFSRVLLLSLALAGFVQSAEPLRVFIRGGKKTHGPGAHEHERFLKDWTVLLKERGMTLDGAMEFPSAQQLARTDVLVLYAQDGGNITPPQRPGLESFLKRGGGLVVIHTASVANTAETTPYWKSLIGGSWVQDQTKWLEGPISLYYVDRTHPITEGAGNFDMDDEIYYDMDLSSEIHVLAASYTPNLRNARRGQPRRGSVSVYDIQPQIWVYENILEGGQPYRAFVSIPGHLFKTFEKPHYRALLLRGIAWAGRRPDLNEFCTKTELESLPYPEGGPSRPAQSLAQLVVHPEFNMSLVASEPLVNNPMNIDWDAQGRLWVAETPEYPDGRDVNPGTDYVQRWQKDDKLADDGSRYLRPAHDKISILMDTDQDGVMDKKRIFYEGLERVTSLALHEDGVIVSQAPDILFLRDTNGDGEADKVETLYTGLGTGDTHAVMNNLRWGFDGWIYATHGYSASQHVTKGDGSKDFGTIGSGVVRFKPDGSSIEQYSSKGGNTWGLQISWDNEVFWTQPTSGDLLMHVVQSEDRLSKSRLPGLSSFQVVHKSTTTYPLIPYKELPYVQIDQVGRFTAAAGCVIYDGGSWPTTWNYNYFTTEPTINIVHHDIVQPNGVTFTSHHLPGREEIEFIAGRDYWFRPIEVRVGPDGALYVIDFYNQAAIHNDTRGPKHGPRNAAIRPDRDHYYGRIWRVDHKDATSLPVPDLSGKPGGDLASALTSPNQHVRMNALRLIAEGNKTDTAPALKQLITSHDSAQAKVAALWALGRINRLDQETIRMAANDSSPAVRKNALMAAASALPGNDSSRSTFLKSLRDPDSRVRLQAINALGSLPADPETAVALVTAYSSLDDDWSRSAVLAAAATSPALFLNTALSVASEQNSELVGRLTGLLIEAADPGEAAKLVVTLADKPSAQDKLKGSILSTFSARLPDTAPRWTPELRQALRKLVTSDNPEVASAALPLAVRWDTGNSLAPEVRQVVAKLAAELENTTRPDEARSQIATTLLGVRQTSPDILPAVAKLLAPGNSAALKASLVETLGRFADEEIGSILALALPNLENEAGTAALNQLLKRVPWAMTLLDGLESGQIPSTVLGPVYAHRLRMHANRTVSTRANELIDALRGPEAKEKQALIARLAPEVEKPGHPDRGRELFIQNCAVCHQFGELGKAAGPILTGMGAHGPAELLGHILDPNREVDPSYVAWSIETKDGEVYDGIISRENRRIIALRNAAGEMEIPKSSVESRRNTGRSLMPEGFEALGTEALRDLLAFIMAGEGAFRVLDLKSVASADTSGGIYQSTEAKDQTLPFVRAGIVKVEGVPFDIIDRNRNPGGKDILVLKGGGGMARNYPQSATLQVGLPISKLHFLSGIGGWAFPYNGRKNEGMPVLKATLHFVGGATQEMLFKNGVEFADYIGAGPDYDVPGSKAAPGIVRRGQVRLFHREVERTEPVERITLESFNNDVAPTVVAVTAELR